jgi:hypothetical protein
MAGVSLPLSEPRSFGQTSRTDRWWIQPAVVFIGLGFFVVYATWAAFQNAHYAAGPYLSPFYSPVLFGDAQAGGEQLPLAYSSHEWFGAKPSWFPSWLPFSPALLILWAPAGFRLTCYYYRGAYYKAFWADPPACAVGEPRKGYIGESNWPLKIMNIHRYFLYIAILFIGMLTYDAVLALWFHNPQTGKGEFGIGIGTLILWGNVILLSGYTFGCHSLRHLVGGRKDCLSDSPTCAKAYRCVSALNRHHMFWAWTSLVCVLFSDIYIRFCSMGIWKDLRII